MVSAAWGIPWRGAGGAAHHLRAMAQAFRHAGAAVRAAGPRFDPPPERAAVALPEGVEPVPLSRGVLPGVLRKNLRWDRLAVGRSVAAGVERLLRDQRVDLLYERAAWGCDLGPVAARHGVRRVLEVNAPLSWEAVLWEGGAATDAWLQKERALYAGAAEIHCVSAALAQWCIGLGADPGRVIHRGQGAAGPRGGAKPCPPAGTAAGRPWRVGCASTWKPWQVGDTVVDELRALAASVAPSPLHLQLWGDGPMRRAVEHGASTLGIECQWMGWGDDAAVAEARQLWDGHWVPRAPWPPAPPVGTTIPDLERTLGVTLPPRWFAELKRTEAHHAGLPTFEGGRWCAAEPTRTWDELARAVLDGSMRAVVAGRNAQAGLRATSGGAAGEGSSTPT